MSVLLGQAYFLRFDPKLWAAEQPYAPLGTLYAAAWLRSRGHAVAVFDAMLAGSEHDWAVALDRARPRLAVLYEDSFNYLSKMCLLRMREAAVRMIGMAKARGCVVAVAGSDATDHPGEYLARGADAVIAGEGEVTLDAVAEAVERGARLDDVAGLWLADRGGTLRSTGPRARLNDLDALPLPAWDLVAVDRYRRMWRRRHGRFSMNLVTTRGCPYQCNWCARPVYGRRYATRSPESVAAEIRTLVDRYRPDHLNFVDDIFGLRPGWIDRFADLMHASGPVPFRCLMRADLVTPAVAASLARAGGESVWIGAESGSQRVLDAMDKGTRVEQIEAATAALKSAGLAVGWFLQFGYPGESRADIERTLSLVRRAEPDDIGISVAYPLPGTKFYDAVRGELGAQRNWRDSSDLAMMYRGPFSTAFYRRLHRLVHREFRLRRARAAWRRQRAAGRAHAAGSALARYGLTRPLDRVRLEWAARHGARPAGPPAAPARRPQEQAP